MTDAAGQPPPVVLVVGATGGIGSAVARAYADRGARLVLASRSAGELADLAARLPAGGGRAETVTVDVTDVPAVEAMFAAAERRFGRVDVVVHSAAVVAYGRFTGVPAEAWRRVVDVGVNGAANVARSALRRFERDGGGHLVLVGSVLGRVTTPFMGSYVTAKFAVRGLARVLQQEARSTPGVHVAIVEPGSVGTAIYTLAGNYLGRVGRPPPPVVSADRVAAAVLTAVDRRRGTVSVGPANPLMRFGFQALPWVYDLLVTPLMRATGLRRGHAPVTDGNVFVPSEQVRERSSGSP